MRRSRSEPGSALVAALILVAVAFTLTSIVTIRATLDAQRVVRQERRVLALNGAEAGLAQVVQKLRFEPWLSEDGGVMARAKWSVKISHDFSGLRSQVATLDAEAVVLDQSRRIRMRVEIWPSVAIELPSTIRLVDWSLLP